MDKRVFEHVISTAIQNAQKAGYTVIIDDYTISFPDVVLQTDDELFNDGEEE